VFPDLKLVADFRDPWTWGHYYGQGVLSPRRKAEEQVRRAVVGAYLIGVERLVRRAGELQPFRFGPGAEVGRSRDADVADAVVEVADVAPVVLPDRIPEGVVLGVEGAFRENRPLDEPRPVEAVRGPVGEQAAGPRGDGLVALL